MNELIIRAGNPYDFIADELEELATTLRSADANLEVSIGERSERGYGVSPWEVVEIVATAGGAAGAVQLTAQAVCSTVAWARRRWEKDRQEHPTQPPRPRSVRLIYGPNGSILRQVSIDLPEGEPIDDARSSHASAENHEETS